MRWTLRAAPRAEKTSEHKSTLFGSGQNLLLPHSGLAALLRQTSGAATNPDIVHLAHAGLNSANQANLRTTLVSSKPICGRRMYLPSQSADYACIFLSQSADDPCIFQANLRTTLVSSKANLWTTRVSS
eukprot:7472328-Pyramimonas_sp.AAC.1